MQKANFKKIDLSKKLNEIKGYSINYSNKLIDDLIEALIISIKKENLNLKNFGSFKLIDKKERIGRNPITKQEYLISKRKSIKFIPSIKLKEKINSS